MHHQFLLDSNITFLNHGSYGACPRPVFEDYQNWQRELERNPVEFLGRRSGGLLQSARSSLAGVVGTAAQNLVFISNSTMGVNAIARSLELRADDEILATDHEYGACSAAWEFVCKEKGCRYIQAPIPLPFDPSGFVERFWQHVTPKTRAIFVSHITSPTALVFPVQEICARARKAGIISIIDGAHAPGHVDLQLSDLGADFYIGNCHKWLMAPKGSAFLFARPECQDLIHGLTISWGYIASSLGLNALNAYTGDTEFERRHQWQGTRDLASFLAVPSAVEFRYRPELQKKFEFCRDLTREAAERIGSVSALPPISKQRQNLQMAAIPIKCDDPARLAQELFEKHRIEIPITSHLGQRFIRISVQIYNTPEDVEKLLTALKQLL